MTVSCHLRPGGGPRECWIPVAFAAPVRSGPNSLRHFRDRQKAQLPQAFARQAWGFESGTIRLNLLSECRFVSEAWGLADLLYKLFSVTFQRPSLIAQPEGWYPFAPILARSKVPNPSL